MATHNPATNIRDVRLISATPELVRPASGQELTRLSFELIESNNSRSEVRVLIPTRDLFERTRDFDHAGMRPLVERPYLPWPRQRTGTEG